jgi:NAD(P)-dependent dehydrogenase (short-subunit alcohol dehydrogenase family)
MEWVLVTGGALGLGAEIACTLASKGFSIVIHYRQHEKEAHAVVEECRHFGVEAECVYGDFSSLEQVKLFLENLQHQFGPISNLINNASTYLVRSALSTTMKEWEEIFQTNFFAPLQIIQGLINGIKASKGAIVNIGVAGLGMQRADEYSPAYTLSKNALWMLTKSLAKEVASEGVRVNLISPGYLENSTDLPKKLSNIPMGRLGTLKEVSALVAFLLEKENAYITGQNIEIAGGTRL